MRTKGLLIRCDICKKPLKKPGALLFSPPSEVPYVTEDDIVNVSVTIKTHICVKCIKKFDAILKNVLK